MLGSTQELVLSLAVVPDIIVSSYSVSWISDGVAGFLFLHVDHY